MKKVKAAPPSLAAWEGHRIMAFDLSLCATGWASYSEGGNILYGTLSAPRLMDGMRRLQYLRNCIEAQCDKAAVVVMEGLSFGSNKPGAAERTGLAYMVRMMLWGAGIPYVLVSPMTLKKFTSGKGNAEKSMQLKSVFQRWGHDCANDNEADACALLHYGLQLCGTEEPQTAIQRECLTKCEVSR